MSGQQDVIFIVVAVILIIGLSVLNFIQWKKNQPLSREHAELKIRYRSVRDDFQRYERRVFELREMLTNNNVGQIPIDKAHVLLVKIHDAYFSSGDQKTFKELMRQIGELKSGNMKNIPRAKEYYGR